MNKAEHLKPWQWAAGTSGNPKGKEKRPRRSFNAVQRFQSLGIDPLQEALSLAQDPALPKTTRLKAWMDLLEYAYPRLAPVASPEKASTRLEELQRSWDTETWDEFKQAFQKELGTLPDATRCELEKLEAKCGFGPLVMQLLLGFVERLHEQATAQDTQDPKQPGLTAAPKEHPAGPFPQVVKL
jgi:hypothetical protein